MLDVVDPLNAEHQSLVHDIKNLRKALMPRLKLFHKLSHKSQKKWMMQDLLMQELLKITIMIEKAIPATARREALSND